MRGRTSLARRRSAPRRWAGGIRALTDHHGQTLLRRYRVNNTKITSSAQLPEEPHMEELDLLNLGGGAGSTTAPWTCAAEGKRVVAIDYKYIGGSCPNIACLPSKKHCPQCQSRSALDHLWHPHAGDLYSIIVMPLALSLREMSFEFRTHMKRYRRR